MAGASVGGARATYGLYDGVGSPFAMKTPYSLQDCNFGVLWVAVSPSWFAVGIAGGIADCQGIRQYCDNCVTSNARCSKRASGKTKLILACTSIKCRTVLPQ